MVLEIERDTSRDPRQCTTAKSIFARVGCGARNRQGPTDEEEAGDTVPGKGEQEVPFRYHRIRIRGELNRRAIKLFNIPAHVAYMP